MLVWWMQAPAAFATCSLSLETPAKKIQCSQNGHRAFRTEQSSNLKPTHSHAQKAT